MSDMSLAQFLTQELRQRGWSGREFANRVGISTSTVSLTLRGRRIPETETIHKMAQTLQLDQRLLLRLAGHLDVEPMRQFEPEVVDLARRISELPPKVRIKAVKAFGGMIDVWHTGFSAAA